MKKTLTLFAVALVAGAVTLGGYKLLEEDKTVVLTQQTEQLPVVRTNFASPESATLPFDFSEAAEKSVHAVVHVKNTIVSRGPTNIMDYFYGRDSERTMEGTGSGVIISADGYIVTNNHVIDNATELEVTLNNNEVFPAELIGTDPKTDIALLKIEANETLDYLAFADSDQVKVGEWVLAVGNPFNLTSTVTAGIVSAKSRSLGQTQSQSFIQTDAAVNRGNSGGALVNTRGELVGINTAITSQTGSYVGYSFAVPSNNAKKVIQDILEYGYVQRGVLGIRGSNAAYAAKNLSEITETEGVYVGDVESGSGADLSGIQRGDIIKQIDGVKITKFTDLTGYVSSKRPNDILEVTYLRDGQKSTVPVTLIELKTYELEKVGIELKKASKERLEDFGADYGLEINRVLSRDYANYEWDRLLIIEINDRPVRNVDDVRRVMRDQNDDDPLTLTLVNTRGEVNKYIIR